MFKKYFLRFCFYAFALNALVACSLFFPDRSAPKSAEYSVTPPSEPWQGMRVGADPASIDALKADIAFEHLPTGAIISLNSVCRKYVQVGLDELTKNLVLGIKDKKTIKTSFRIINGVKAKDTLFSGTVDNESIIIRTIVLKKNLCTYDFIYVATKQNTENSMNSFDRFIASFQTE